MREQADQQFRDIIDKGSRSSTRPRPLERRERMRVDRLHPGLRDEDAAPRRDRRLRRAHEREARRLARARHVDARGPGNADVTPGSASSTPRVLPRRPVRRRLRFPVTAVVKSVSKAGVAQATWSQPTQGTRRSTASRAPSAGRRTTADRSSLDGSATFVRSRPARGRTGFQPADEPVHGPGSGRDGRA